jgi:hypothetical protein
MQKIAVLRVAPELYDKVVPALLDAGVRAYLVSTAAPAFDDIAVVVESDELLPDACIKEDGNPNIKVVRARFFVQREGASLVHKLDCFFIAEE